MIYQNDGVIDQNGIEIGYKTWDVWAKTEESSTATFN